MPPRRRFTGHEKRVVAARQTWRCARCDVTLEATFEVDHVVPLHLGGADFGIGGRADRPVYNTSGDYSSLMFARKASEWIEEHGQARPTTPMFLYVAFQEAHSPFQAPSDYLALYPELAHVPNKQAAAAMVSLAALGAGAASLWARAVPPAGD